MKVSQQIVGVNQRLGNTAVPNMQGTTRAIFDTVARASATDQTLTYFSGVSSRPWPLSNISQNKFEVGESLAIQAISFMYRPTTITTYASGFDAVPAGLTATANYTQSLLLNFYIGNQRVIKDMEISGYSKFSVGEVSGNSTLNAGTVIRLETPIIIPPQIEFYATLRETGSSGGGAGSLILAFFGTGTLLNTKSNF
jgi:hypothetical protein